MNYLTATVTVFGTGLLAVVGVVVIRPNADNAMIITQIIGFTATTSAALLAFLKAQETHLVVNSRIDEFKRSLEAVAAVKEDMARASGIIEGRSAANARTDELAEQAKQP